jgi:hypothetical protein
MKRFSLLFIVVTVLGLYGTVRAQDGSVQGVIHNQDGTPAPGAFVRMAGLDGHDPLHHPWFFILADGTGHFGFRAVPDGFYSISACALMHGFASQVIEVRPNHTTNVTMTLSRRPEDNPPPRDSLTMVQLEGVTIVIPPNPTHPDYTRYGLDVNHDGVMDYRLNFGPGWYQSDSGAVRPDTGEPVIVIGGLLTYTNPPVVVVYRINRLLWRDPAQGHGGYGGGDYRRGGCNPDSVTRVEFEGEVSYNEHIDSVVVRGPDQVRPPRYFDPFLSITVLSRDGCRTCEEHPYPL